MKTIYKWHKWILAVIIAATITGCSTITATGPEAFRITAERVTIGALLGNNSSIETAERIRDLSINVRELIDTDWTHEEIKAAILMVIRDQLEGRDQAIAVYLTNEVTNMVIFKLENGDILPTQVRIYVQAAAKGVESGANVYILMFSDKDISTE